MNDRASSEAHSWAAAIAPHELIQRIGQMTRLLRASMRELGLDKEIEKAAQAIPDARERLGYVAAMTEQAAGRVIDALERAQPRQTLLIEGARDLDARWQAWLAAPQQSDEARRLVEETRRYIGAVPGHTQATQGELLEILMAQDFQDLTGQVIKKMIEVIREIEQQLLRVLIDSVPANAEQSTLQRLVGSERADRKGPQVKPTEGDAVTGQAQVDDLLAQLGF